MGYLYLGESGRGRILRYGIGYAQVGDAYNLKVRTWDQRPAGPIGLAVMRTCVAVIRHKAGYDVQLTPVVDGLPMSAKRFSGGAPDAAKLEEYVTLTAPVFRPGASLGVIFETLSLPGEIELVDLFGTTPVVRASS